MTQTLVILHSPNQIGQRIQCIAIQYSLRHTSIILSGESYWPSLAYFSLDCSSTTKKGATAMFNFTGNAAYVFGGTSEKAGFFTVSVDDGDEQSFNGTSVLGQNYQVLLVRSFCLQHSMSWDLIVLYWNFDRRPTQRCLDKLARYKRKCLAFKLSIHWTILSRSLSSTTPQCCSMLMNQLRLIPKDHRHQKVELRLISQ